MSGADCVSRMEASRVAKREFLLSLLVITGVIAPYSSISRSAGYPWPSSVYCDYESLQLPTREYANRMLRVGVIPFWNPHIGLGMPVVERQQSGLFYPPGWLALLCGDCDWAIRATLFVHLGFLAISQFRLAVFLGASPLAAAASTSLICHSGYMHGHVLAGHINLVYASCLVPATLRSAIMLSRGTCSTMNCGGWLALMYLTGHPQPVFYAAYAILLIGWTGSASLRCGQPVRSRLRKRTWLRQWIVAGCWATVFSAVQLLPAVQLAARSHGISERGTLEFADSLGIRGRDLISLFVEWPDGSPWGRRETAGIGYPHERSLWVGAGAFIWFTATVCSWRRLDGFTRWLILLILVGLITCLGSRTPGFTFLQYVPGLKLFRCHGRILVVVIPIVGLVIARSFTRTAVSIRGLQTSLVFSMCIAVEPVVAGLQLATCFGQARSRIEAQSIDGNSSDALFPGRTVTAVAVSREAYDGLPVPSEFLTDDRGGAAQWPGFLECHRSTSDIRSGSVLPLSQFPRVTSGDLRYAASSREFIAPGWCTPACCEGGALPKATLLSHEALTRNAIPVASLIGCRSIQAAGRIFELPESLPRIRLLRKDAPLEVPVGSISASEIRQLHLSLVQPSHLSVIEYGNTVLIDVEADEASTLVMASSAEPGWSCRDRDGAKPIRPAHGIFRSIELSAGRHELTCRFVSWPTAVGALLSAASLVSALFVTFGGRVRRANERIVDTRKCLF